MKKTIILALAISMVIAGVAMASVVSSKHDMRYIALPGTALANRITAGPTEMTSQVCVFCHHPHRGATSNGVTNTLLWNINAAAHNYPVYANTATLDYATHADGYTVGTDTGEDARYTLLCLGCHDGTTAVASNSFIRTAADGSLGAFPDLTQTNTSDNGAANLGTTLADDHPVDFTYPTLRAGSDTDVNIVVTGGKVDGEADGIQVLYPLFGGTMQCATCHDVHNGSSPHVEFMRGLNPADMSEQDVITSSKICRDCHTHK